LPIDAWMNFRRGFNRLFLVIGALYYLIGGWSIYSGWTERIASRAAALADMCPGGHSKPPEPSTYFQVYDENTCNLLTTPVKWDWTDTLIYALLPVLLYGAWRILAWIGRGFKMHPQPSI
jgi:hypothetical protein